MEVNMRPAEKDYNPYYKTYIDKVEYDNPVTAMEKYSELTKEFFHELGEKRASVPYGEGKWTYKETLGHIIDTERVMAYRALCIGRSESKPLPGFDQDLYVKNGNFNNIPLGMLLNEYIAVRESSILLFKNLRPYDMNKRGIANDNEVTVLALAFIIAGHEKHHINVLKERLKG